MLVLDVDGVLTDCSLWMDSNGEWKRVYSVRDGVGIKRMIEEGYQLAVITGSKATDVQARVRMLGFQYFYEGFMDKVPAFLELQKKSGLSPDEMAYVGDDIYDIPLLQEVGFSATVPEAVKEVKKVVDYVTQCSGGKGAVREVCDSILLHGAYSKKTVSKEKLK